ncbi:MAG: 3-hydroxyacyl-CoA dehydrogenase [Burkholderiales bacterium]|nr:3-hydroxyacyl-CoA dehydrogenase [Burkholderiales bacterium]|tara:strand:+ start:1865 stop:2632 length:768 start_codon:yes stop_codon:yes gene_type:complete
MKIKDNTVIVTGGASGLGAATAEMIVTQGGNVVIADMNVEAGQTLAGQLGAAARFIECDVTQEDHANVTIALAQSEFGGLQGLVNCAGIAIGEKTIGKNGPHRLETFARVININLIGSFNMLRVAANAMAKQDPNTDGERGVIINTASVAAFDGQIGQVAYAASKGGIAGMTLPIARDLSRSGIRIITIAPGIFETAMLMGMPKEVQDSLGQQVPFPSRLGRPSEYAGLVHSIFDNVMLNGETIRLDGAIRMTPK